MATPRDLIKQMFESSPSVFQNLSQARTRRVGQGYKLATGKEEALPVTGNVHLDAGPLGWDSKVEPVPISEVERALLSWAACGPSGMALLDIDTSNDLSTAICFNGRTVPGPCNDNAIHLFYTCDEGTYLYKPPTNRSKPVEIEGDADYDKVLDWFRNDSIKISDNRIDLDWGSPEKWGPAGKGALAGIWQVNFNRKGSIVFFPAAEIGKEMINVLFSGMEFMHWLFVDDDTGEPMGLEEWARPGYLEVPVPWSMYEEIILSLEHCVMGMAVQNIRLASEAMGLGHWNFGGIAEDLILGGIPELSKGLGFNYTTFKNRNFFQGLPGVWEGWCWPAPWWKSTDEIIEKNVQLRYNPEGVFFGSGCKEGCIDTGPYTKESLEAIRNNPKIKIADWVQDASKALMRYIVDKYGRFPVHFSPFHAQFVCQVHHLDLDFYKRHFLPNYIHERHTNHMNLWHKK